MSTPVTFSQLIKSQRVPQFVTLNKKSETEVPLPEPVAAPPPSSVTPMTAPRPELDSHQARERPSQVSAEP